jgi:hypothetical protein
MKAILSLLFFLLSFQHANALITWSSTPVTISTPDVDATFVQVGIDGNGNVVAIWLENGYVQSSICLAGGSWSAPVTISTAGTASSPALVVDSNGNATALWNEGSSIKTSAQPFGDAWSAPSTLASSGASHGSLSVDPSGNVVAIWVASGAIESSTKLYGGSWSTTPSVLAASGASMPQISVGSSGNVFAVWHAINPISSMDAIYSASKTISGTWSTAVVVSSDTQNCNYPNIAVDSNGNAIAIWFRYGVNGTQYNNVVLQASEYDSSGFSWNTPTDLSTGGIRDPAYLESSVSFCSAGNATAVWTNSDDGSTYFLSSASLPINGNWISENIIPTDLYMYSFSQSVDAAGDLYLVYMNYDNSTVAIQNSLSILAGPSLNYFNYIGMLSNGNQNAYPKVAVTSNTSSNFGAAAWISYDGTNQIVQALTGSGTPIQAPSGLTVAQSSTDYGVFTVYYNTLNWEASPSPTVGFYIVYRNGIPIQNMPSNVLTFVDENAIPGLSVTYGIASIDENTGEVSSIATVTYP